MFRRLVISLSLLLAFALLQAHNFIPHHHHEEKPVKTAHHHHHGRDDDDHDHDNKTGNHLPITDLDHSIDFGKVVAKPQFDKGVIEKPVFAGTIIIWLCDKLTSFESPPRPHPPDKGSRLHDIFLSHSVPLRAPPVSSYLS
jgi:hypothetical protein